MRWFRKIITALRGRCQLRADRQCVALTARQLCYTPNLIRWVEASLADLAISGLKAVPVVLSREYYTIGGTAECDLVVPELGACGQVAWLQVEGGTVLLGSDSGDARVLFVGTPLNAGRRERLLLHDSFSIAGRTLTITPALVSLTQIREPGLTWAVLRFLVGLLLLLFILPIQLMFSGSADMQQQQQQQQQQQSAEGAVSQISWDLPFVFPPPVLLLANSGSQLTSGMDDRSSQLESLLGTPAFASTFLDTMDAKLQTVLAQLPTAQQLSLLACYALFGGFINCGGSLGLSAQSRVDINGSTPGLDARLGPGGWLGPLSAMLIYFFALYGPVSMFLLMAGVRSALSMVSAMLRYGLRFLIISIVFILLFSVGASIALKVLLARLSLLDFLVSLKVVTPFSHPGILGRLIGVHLLYLAAAVTVMLLLNIKRLKRGLVLEHAAVRATGKLLAAKGRAIAEQQRGRQGKESASPAASDNESQSRPDPGGADTPTE